MLQLNHSFSKYHIIVAIAKQTISAFPDLCLYPEIDNFKSIKYRINKITVILHHYFPPNGQSSSSHTSAYVASNNFAILKPTFCDICFCHSRLHSTLPNAFFQRELSIIDFTLNYPPIRNNLTSAIYAH